MNFLDSAWLIDMLKKSGATPQARILALFDVLDDWIKAPGVREALAQYNTWAEMPEHLIAYLTQQASLAGASLPESLAHQIYFIAQSAMIEGLNNPDSAHFSHAKLAASAVLYAQIRGGKPKRYMVYGLAASLCVSVLAVGIWQYLHSFAAGERIKALTTMVETPAALTSSKFTSPKNTADMYASLEQMREGDCHYPEALQVPERHRRVYIENVVGGQAATTEQDRAIAEIYLAQVNCSYTPKLMKNSLN
jgi:hypothetical protein